MEKIINYDSEDAATYRTDIKGWVDSKGFYRGENEAAARYSGCTHKPCSVCGILIRKGRSLCDVCTQEKETERYNKLPKVKWSSLIPVYSSRYDEYANGEDELRELLERYDCSIEDLQLVECELLKFRELDESYFCDGVAEDEELPSALVVAIDKLNAVIRKLPQASWVPGKRAATVEL